MITYHQYEQSEKMYPMPEYVGWYQRSFPSKQIAFFGAGFIVIGMILTIAKVARIHLLAVTLQIVFLVVWLCTMLLVAIVKKRSTFKKRAEYLGVTLHEYMSFDLVNTSITSKILRWYDTNFG